MKGVYMDVCLALGILVSELNEEPWSGKLITFNTNLELQKFEGEDLRLTVNFVRGLEVGSATNFQKGFHVILKLAEAGKLKEEQMIKR
uniref:DUF7788 domain-containing protein n=1 Tax=Daucus carota subsp. sativus TaxID=79200 RepID=A0A161Y1Y9_DAUCS